MLLASLADTAMLGVLILSWSDGNDANVISRSLKPPIRPIYVVSIVVVLAALGMIIGQSIINSGINVNRRAEYRRILADISRLQAEGRLAADAIIISPAHGLPWEWSNPLILEFPKIPFLDTGWITFSPSYEQALRQYDIEPLPEALYQKGNVYLMTKQVFQPFLARYYQEHEHITVTFEPIYNMPNIYHVPEYDDIQLYRVVLVK